MGNNICESSEFCLQEKIEGSLILSEQYDDKLIVYIYDENGSPLGMMYREDSYANEAFDCYLYEKNLQGDITGIYNKDGKQVVWYEYDAWGNLVDYEFYSSYKNICDINPFRYRGYYYDTETGFYYLNSRYYDPVIGRFVNADDIAYLGADGSYASYNLYAYCGNDSVNFKQSPVSSGGSVISSSLSGGGSIGIGESSSVSDSVSNAAVPWYAQTIVGAIPDLYSGVRYLMAKGMHQYFAYKKNYYYMFPILGKTHNRLAIHSTSFGKLSNATFRELVTSNAKASIGSVIGNTAGVGLFTFGTNLLFNLYENGFDLTDKAMWIDTGIDTAIGMGAYGLATGTASLATAGLAMAGVALPGIVVVGGVVILSIGFDHLIRDILGYWD